MTAIVMEGIYEISSSDRVKRLEEDLCKELKELQNAIEENDFLKATPQKSFSSIPIPKDAGHFKSERRIALTKALQVREARCLQSQANVMTEDMKICSKAEYTNKSLPLLLHQFYVDRVEELVQCKHMHMLRWARFCEHTKTIEMLYPSYQERLSLIMAEYQDALDRAHRLAVAKEAALVGSESAMNVVTLDDLLIYTRSLVCHLHSVKKIHAFLKVVEWLPYSHPNAIQLHPSKPETSDQDTKTATSYRARRRYSRVMSQVSVVMQLNLLRPTSEEVLPSPPPLSLSSYQLVASTSPSVAAAAAASGGGLASDEINLAIPLHETSLEKLKPMLEFLIGCYAIEMDIHQVNTYADEMELFTLVSRKFKKVFSKQEQLRSFPVYDALVEDISDNKIRGQGIYCTFKKESNWLSALHLRPEKNADQVKMMTKLRQQNYIDEIIKTHATFLRVQQTQRVLNALREHAKAVVEPPVALSVSVTTHKTSYDTAAVWQKIFAHTISSSRDDVLEFDAKIGEEVSSQKESEFEVGSAVDMLGLDEEGSRTRKVMQGAYMSFLLLRHLRLRDLQRTCLSILNYCRSIERTLTINDSGLSLEQGRQKATNRKVFHGGGVQGVGSHQYIHNTPADFVVEHNEFMSFSELENHDDFFTFEEGRLHVQDQRGFYIMYDTALEDFKNLETDLLLVATQFVEKDKELRVPKRFQDNVRPKFGLSDIDISAYGHQHVDRFGVLLDLWSNEAIYLENKRQLLDTYYEAYQHTFNPKEKRKLAQVIVNVLHQRPRFDFTEPYFVKLYRAENVCLRLHCNLIKSVLDKQIADEREYVQKVTRDGDSEFGLPHRIIPKQSIAVNTSRPCLKYVYMLEFHPSLSLASAIPKAIEHVLKAYISTNNPRGFMETISIEKCLFELIQKEWDNMEVIGASHSHQTQKDLFAEVFVEDPLFICEIGQSQLSALESNSGGRRSVKERQQSLIKTWCDLLEVLTLRHRLVTAAQETEVLAKVYKRKSKEFGFDEHHVYLRAVSFDFAQSKPEAELHRIPIDSIMDDDGRIDRYTPGALPLAIQELDEKHVGSINFRTREGLMQLASGAGIEKLQVILAAQVVHKNLLIAAVTLAGECLKSWNRERSKSLSVEKNISSSGVSTLKVPVVSSMDLDLDSRESSGSVSPSQLTTFTPQLKRDRNYVPKMAFVSVQLEKVWLRDLMLNEYVNKKSNMGVILKNVDEAMKLKRKLILSFCEGLQLSISEYSMRAQIIAYYGSLLDLMSQFPTTRNAHFMIGEEHEDKLEDQEKPPDEQIRFTRRPRTLLSDNGQHLVNLWFIPHYTEILSMFSKLPRNVRNKSLKVVLEIVSSLHDICQYLCAHARLGSSHARLGSHKLEFSGVTADWGGTEGIGAELREIQKQINHLEDATNPQQVADFLRHRRDVMYLEFDISISHCVPDTFLQTGNETACKSIMDNMEFALQNLSNLPRPSLYSCCLSVPEPFQSIKETSSDLVPWRTFLSRNGPLPFQYWPWYEIGTNMQLCLAGLKDVDRHVVNGEILGVSLLLEDVLQNGLPNDILGQPDDTSSVTSSSLALRGKDRKRSVRSSSVHSTAGDGVTMEISPQNDIPRGQLSYYTDPPSAAKLVLLFLVSWSRLEVLKRDWGCRKLGVNTLNTTKMYKAFCKAYKVDVLQPVVQHIALKKGVANEYVAIATVSDDEPLATPPGTTDMELKIKQLIRMLENFECSMITDVIRKISREQTLALSERGRDDATLPTDLWKRPVMKESTTIEKPHMVENFVRDLMVNHIDQEDTIIFPKTHFNLCLVKLASETMMRERSCFDSYAMYYENLLRHQHQLLYTKEQGIKQLRSNLTESNGDTRVDVHCQLADKSHELLLEITALRARIKEMTLELTNKESEIRDCLTKDYNILVRDLFSRCFSMRNKFEEFRGSLYDDVLENLSDVRRHAMENMRKIKERSGTLSDDVAAESSIHLERAERIRMYQEENKHLGALFYKVRTLNSWKNTRMDSHHFETVNSLREEADRAKKECLDIKRMYEEKEMLLKQEQAALRKALSQVEKEAQTLKKKLSHEQKVKLQKTHTRMQEARSMKQMELAKSTNIDKLISDLEERENQLRYLSENLTRDQKMNVLATEHSKKAKKQILQKLEHERNLKLGAFERVDELQRQVYNYEQVYELPLTVRPQTTPPSLLPPTSDNRLSSAHRVSGISRSALPQRRAFSSKPTLGGARQESRSSYGGGLWPPAVPLPAKNSLEQDSSYSNKLQR